MQSGQVSVWVPIVVGVLGLVAVIAGQLVSAWREDRRWMREQQREDVRWARELDREDLNRASADRTHWRDKKFEIYNDFLTFMKQWRDLNHNVALQIAHKDGPPQEAQDRLHKLDRESFEHQDRIELIATDRRAQQRLLDAIRTYMGYAGRMQAGHLPVDTKQVALDEFVDANEAMINIILAAIRIDLGISDDIDTENLTLLENYG